MSRLVLPSILLILGSSRLIQRQLSTAFTALPACGAHLCLLQWSLLLTPWLLAAWLAIHSRQLQHLWRLELQKLRCLGRCSKFAGRRSGPVVLLRPLFVGSNRESVGRATESDQLCFNH